MSPGSTLVRPNSKAGHVADILIYDDYEFHFTDGDVLDVTLQRGRDTMEVAPDRTTALIVRESTDLEERYHVPPDHVAYLKVTRRTVELPPDRRQPRDTILELD